MDIETNSAPSTLEKQTPNRKNIKIIGILIITILIISVIATLLISNNKKPSNTSTNNSRNTLVSDKVSPQSSLTPTPDQNSEFVGYTDKCEPMDDHQWYRSDSTLTIDPNTPSNLSIFIEKRGFFTTNNAAETWNYKSKGIKGFKSNMPNYKNRPCYLEFRASAIDPTNPKHILLGALGDFDTINSMFNQAGGLLETFDGGETWKQILTNDVNAYVHDIAIDPTNPLIIYYVTSSQKPQNREKSLMTKGLVYKTTDGGKSWVELSTGLLPNTGGQDIFIDSNNPKRLMFTSLTFNFNAQGKRSESNDSMGIMISEDAGMTWTSRKTLPAGDEGIITSSNSPTNFNNLYVSIFSDNGARSYYSTDAAKSFKKSGLPVDVVAYDPTDSTGKTLIGYAWQSSPGRSLLKSTNAGATWTQIGTLPSEIVNIQDPKTRISKIVIDPKNNQNIYLAGANAYVWKSVNGGKTWTTTMSLETIP